MDVYLPIANLSVNALVMIALGAGVGLLSGMFGVGGGFLTTPLLIVYGIPPTVAAASAASQVTGASVSGVFAHFRRGGVDLPDAERERVRELTDRDTELSLTFSRNIRDGRRTTKVPESSLRGLPEDRIRYHLCWGSWHGPHAFDIELDKLVDLMLRVRAQAYLIEAANARHEHEYIVWDKVKLPDGKILIPGMISHATDGIEHPELVAQRIRRFARRVGAENMMAGTDCGFGGRSHPQIAWAKLKALVEGAELASKSGI